MKTKPLFFAVAGLAALAAAGWWWNDRSSAPVAEASPMEGRKLLAPEELQSAAQIRLAGADEAGVLLARQEDGTWVLPEYFGLPADFEKLSSLTRNLLEGSVDRHVTRNPERLERLELGQSTVQLIGADGTHLWQIETGSSRQGGGQFIRLHGKPSAYLTHASLFIDTSSRNWPVKKPLPFEEGDVAQARFTVAGEELVFRRAERGAAFAGEGLAENEKARDREVARIVRSLVTARFNEAVDASDEEAKDARAHAVPVTLELFSGETYTLHVGRRPSRPLAPGEEGGIAAIAPRNEHSASIVFDSEGRIVSDEELARKKEELGVTPPAVEPEPIMSEPGPVFIFFESSDEAFVWTRLMDRAALRFPDHLFTQLPTSRDRLVETVVITGADEVAPASD